MQTGTLTESLKAFQVERGKLTAKREKRTEALRDLFVPIARVLLTGGYFEVSSDDRIIRRIFPYTVEFYYHEEGEGETKDYIVYHRNPDDPAKNGGKTVTPFLPCSFHTHVSGIDVTFESETYRASALIRAYQVIDGPDGFPSVSGLDIPEVNPHSTYLYNNLLMGIDIESGIQVRWKNEPWGNPDTIRNGLRVNVCEYDTENKLKPVKKTKKTHHGLSPEQIQDKKPWAFSRGEFTGLCKIA